MCNQSSIDYSDYHYFLTLRDYINQKRTINIYSYIIPYVLGAKGSDQLLFE